MNRDWIDRPARPWSTTGRTPVCFRGRKPTARRVETRERLAVLPSIRDQTLDFEKTLRMVDAFFGRHGQPWALAGAAALSTYGLARATQDLDFVADAGFQDRLVPHLEAAGYRTLHRSAGYSNHLHTDVALGRLDFVYVGGETSRRLFDECREAVFGGRTVRVPRPEHLAAMKVQAMKNDPDRRLQDLADVRFLLSVPGVDGQEVRGYFERAGLLRDFDEIHPAS